MNITHSKPTLAAADREAVYAALETGHIACGQRVLEFERAASAYLGLAGGAATASGTSALLLILRAMGIGQGDEVVIPTYVCRAVWEAVVAAGANPVLCDVAEDWCMAVDHVRPRITARTRAVVVVHIFGIMADARRIAALGVPVIEDICQRFGAPSGGSMAGACGRFAFASFHGTKLLTTGEGGMALAGTPADAQCLTETARGEKAGAVPVGRVAPMSDLAAALGLAQLRQYPQFLARRQYLAERYTVRLAGLPIQLPLGIMQRSIHFRYPVRIAGVDFEALRERCAKRGVHIRRGVDALLHRMGLPGTAGEEYPGAERLFDETVSLPIYPALTDALQDHVCETLTEALG